MQKLRKLSVIMMLFASVFMTGCSISDIIEGIGKIFGVVSKVAPAAKAVTDVVSGVATTAAAVTAATAKTTTATTTAAKATTPTTTAKTNDNSALATAGAAAAESQEALGNSGAAATEAQKTVDERADDIIQKYAIKKAADAAVIKDVMSNLDVKAKPEYSIPESPSKDDDVTIPSSKDDEQLEQVTINL